MSSPYDILIDIRARAQEVIQATTAIQAMVDKAAATGPALATGLNQGQTAAAALTRDIASASQAAGQLGSQGAAAGGALAGGMDRGSAAAEQAAEKVKQVGDKTREVKSLADEASASWLRFGGSLSEAFTFGFGTELAQKAIELFLEVPKLMVEATEKGVEFDREMETLGIGLASALRQAQPEKYLNFTAARTSATQAITAIQQKANALGLDFNAVGETLKTSMLPLVEGGITDIDKQIEVMTLLMQASAAKGIQGFQAMRDVMDILAGRAERVMLSRELGITNDDIKRAQEAGTLYDYLLSKLGAYKEAGDAASQTFNGLWQSVKNLFVQLEGTAAMPVFDELKTDLAQIKTLLDSVQAKGFAQTTALQFGGVIDGLKELYGWMQKIASFTPGNIAETLTGKALDAVSDNPQAIGQLAAQVDANQQIVLSLQKQAQEARTGEQVYNAIRATQEAIDKAVEQAATSTGDQKTAAENLATTLEAVMRSIGKTADDTHDAAGAAGEMTTALAGANKELSDMLAKLPGIVAGMKDAANAANLASQIQNAGTSGQKLNILQGARSDVLQYINQNAQQLGYGGVVDATGVRNLLDSYSKDSSSGAVGMPGDSTAIQNIVAAYQKLLPLDQQITQERRQQSDLDKKAVQSASDRTQQEAIFAAQAAGDKTHADQLDRAKDIQQEALKISKDENVSWDDAVARATEYVDLQNKAKDAADAEKNAKKESAAAGKEAAQAARDQRMEDSAAEKDRNTAIQAFRNARADLKADPFQSDEQKLPQEIKLLDDERKALLANVLARDAYIKAHQNDPKFAVPVSQAIGANVRDGQAAMQIAQEQRLLTITGQVQAQTLALGKTWGTTAQAIGSAITQTITTAIGGLSDAITGLITGTKSWGQAFAQVGQSIIRMIIQIVLQQIIGRALIFAINTAFGSAESSEAQTQGDSALSAWSAAAIAASIASYGTAAGVGLAAYAAAIAAGTAGGAVAGSFAEGGMIKGRPSHRDNRIAHVATGEFIMRTSATQFYGADFMHRLNRMEVPRTGFATGGLVGDRDGYTPILASVSSGTPNVNVGGHSVTLIQTRDRSEMLQALQSSEGKKIVLGHVKNHRTQVGIKS